jgi:hypothetical protein
MTIYLSVVSSLNFNPELCFFHMDHSRHGGVSVNADLYDGLAFSEEGLRPIIDSFSKTKRKAFDNLKKGSALYMLKQSACNGEYLYKMTDDEETQFLLLLEKRNELDFVRKAIKKAIPSELKKREYELVKETKHLTKVLKGLRL